jgi:tetratricopeptide (TPR) repeat protein
MTAGMASLVLQWWLFGHRAGRGLLRGKCSILVAMRSACFLYLVLGFQTIAAQTANQEPAANVDALLSAGISAQQTQDYKTAIEDYRKVLAIRPEMAEARANLGAALAATGDFDAAIEQDKLAMAVASDKVSVRMNLALAYYKKGDMAQANTEFEAVHAERPADVKASMLLAYTDMKVGKNAEAAALLTPIEPGHETDTDFEYVYGYALIETGKSEAGVPRMEKVALATRSVDAYFIAGSARLRKSEFREARADLDAALELNPNFPGLYTLAGQARDAMGDTAASVPAFEAALRANPKDPTANLYLGVIKLKARDFDNARPLLELALELQPQLSQARFQVAKLNSLTGKYAEAAAALEDLERSDPNWLDPHVELAAVYYKLHRPEDGQRERDIVQQIEAKQQQAGSKKD